MFYTKHNFHTMWNIFDLNIKTQTWVCKYYELSCNVITINTNI